MVELVARSPSHPVLRKEGGNQFPPLSEVDAVVTSVLVRERGGQSAAVTLVPRFHLPGAEMFDFCPATVRWGTAWSNHSAILESRMN